VVFRFDDYSAISSTDVELKIIRAFREHEAPFTIAVIPFVSASNLEEPGPMDPVPLPPEKGAILKAGVEAGIVEVALHGYCHRTIDSEHLTEFAGLDYDSQIQRLAEGRRFLEAMIGSPVTTFVPPWNAYDSNTIRALEELGFETLSARRFGEVPAESEVQLLPATCYLDGLPEAVEDAYRSADQQPIVVVGFHEYDFVEVDEEQGMITLGQLHDLLSWLRSQSDVRILSIGQAAEVSQDLGRYRYLRARWSKRLLTLLPPGLFGQWQTSRYPEAQGLPIMLLTVGGFYLLLTLATAALSYLLARLAWSRYTAIVKSATFGSVLLSAIVVMYVFGDLQAYHRGMMLCSATIGVTAGLGLCVYRCDRRMPDSDYGGGGETGPKT
jgi:peptidoglycan/xylan/chitin deacetylase (PgdA/CDA1 family)